MKIFQNIRSFWSYTHNGEILMTIFSAIKEVDANAWSISEKLNFKVNDITVSSNFQQIYFESGLSTTSWQVMLNYLVSHKL